MDKDDLIRQLDRQLRIRAMFAFERRRTTSAELEREFARTAIDMIRRQPAMAEALGVPVDLLDGEGIHEA